MQSAFWVSLSILMTVPATPRIPKELSAQNLGYQDSKVLFLRAWDDDLLKRVEGTQAIVARDHNGLVHEPLIDVVHWGIKCGAPIRLAGATESVFQDQTLKPDGLCLELVLSSINAPGAMELDVDSTGRTVRAIWWPETKRSELLAGQFGGLLDYDWTPGLYDLPSSVGVEAPSPNLGT